MIALNKIKNAVHRLNLSQIIFCSLLCFASIFFALEMLIVIQDARGLGFSFVNSPDGVMFMRKSFVFFFFILFTIMACILAAGRRNRLLSERFILIFSLLVLLIQAGSSYTASQALFYFRSDFELHGRALSQFIRNELKTNNEKITMISDEQEFHIPWLPSSIAFWLPARQIESPITFISFKEYYSGDRKWNDKLYIITRSFFGNPLYSYAVKEQNYYIYDFKSWFQGRRIPDKNSY